MSARTSMLRLFAYALAFTMLVGSAASEVQAEEPHLDADGNRFPVGMYKMMAYPDSAHHYDFQDVTRHARFDSIWKGHPGGNEACNVFHFTDGPWRYIEEHTPGEEDWYCAECWDEYPDLLIERFLEPLYDWSTGYDPLSQPDPESLRMRVILGPLYQMFVSSVDGDPEPLDHQITRVKCEHKFLDHHLRPGRTHLSKYVRTICEWERDCAPGLIAGWYVQDEPNCKGSDLAEYWELVDAVRAIEDSIGLAEHHPMYVALAAGGFLTHEDPPGEPPGAWNPYVWASVQQCVNWNGQLYVREEPFVPFDYCGCTDENGDPIDISVDPNAVHFIGAAIPPIPDDDDDRFPTPTGDYEGEWLYTVWEADHVMVDHYAPPDYGKDAGKWGAWISNARKHFELYGNKRYPKPEGSSQSEGWYFDAAIPAHVNSEGFPSHEELHGLTRHVADLNVDGIWYWAWWPTGDSFRDSAIKGHWMDGNRNWAEVVENEIEGRDQLIMAFNGVYCIDDDLNIINRFNIDDYEELESGSLGDATRICTDETGAISVDAVTMGDFDGDGDDQLVTAYTTANGLTKLRLSDNPPDEPWNQHLLPYPPSYEIIDMVSGDLEGDGLDELVIAYGWDNAGAMEYHVVAYRLGDDDMGGYLWDYTQGLELYDSADPPSEYPLSALVAGDFDGNGVDEVLIAFSDVDDSTPVGHELCLVDKIYSGETPHVRTPFTCGGWESGYVHAMTSGDYDGDVDEAILFFLWAFDDWSGAGGDEYGVLRLDVNRDNYDTIFDSGNNWDIPEVFTSNAETPPFTFVEMTTGDYDGDMDDETFLSVSNPYFGTQIFFLENPQPGDIVDGEGLSLPGDLPCWVATGMASGDFTVSDLPRPDPPPKRNEEVLPPTPPRERGLPEVFALRYSSPNPFNPVTTIAYDVPHESPVTIEVYNVAGKRVRTLVHETKEPGWYTVPWDGTSESGEAVASGVYFCKMRAGGFTDIRKMTLLK